VSIQVEDEGKHLLFTGQKLLY